MSETLSPMESNEADYTQPTDDDEFWLRASESSLKLIWDNPEDDVFAELLETDVSIPRTAMSTFEEILSAALALPPDMRAALADHLLASLDGEDQKRIDALWAEEAERRIHEIDEGKVEMIDGETFIKSNKFKIEDYN